VTPAIANGMQEIKASKPGKGRCPLTRQREVLRLVAEGRTAKESAELSQSAIRFGILAL
jgi:DNA-binding NarL/FixJ family response regulator